MNKKSVTWSLSLILSFSLLVFLTPAWAMEEQAIANMDDKTLHLAIVNHSIKTDAYNKQCRGIRITRNFDKTNRLFITKYSLTVNNFIEWFILDDARRHIKQTGRDMLVKVMQSGGCAKTKELGWVDHLNQRYNKLFRAVDNSYWFPIEPKQKP